MTTPAFKIDMPRRCRVGARGLTAVALICTSCGIDLEVTPGQYVDYAHHPDLEPCSGNATYVDGFGEFVTRLMMSDFGHAEFSWVPADEFGRGVLRRCEGVIGCTPARTAYSQWPIHLHEVVHALMFSVNEEPLPFFQEGIASAFDLSLGLTLEDLFVQGVDRSVVLSEITKREHIDYDVAGLLVVYLLQRYGVDLFMDVYAGSARAMTMSEIDTLFMGVYGVGVNSLVDEFLAATVCTPDIVQFPQYDCTSSMIAVGVGGDWSFEKSMDCHADDVYGALGGDWGMLAARTFEVTLPGLYTVNFSGPAFSLAHVASCGGCRWIDPQVVLPPGQSETVYLFGGLHALTTRVFEQQDISTVLVTITPAT